LYNAPKLYQTKLCNRSIAFETDAEDMLIRLSEPNNFFEIYLFEDYCKNPQFGAV
jgi:hypothetical protein